jgi:dephospho-CoA kinase
MGWGCADVSGERSAAGWVGPVDHEAQDAEYHGLFVIGLTGNIATGKSVVAAMLAGLGAEVIDADALAHEVMKAGTVTWQRVVDEFGSDILHQDGEIDRARLGEQVFADPQALERLEAIVHPAVIAETERLLKAVQDRPISGDLGVKAVVLEAIKLIESGMHRRCDELWVVTCTRDQQVERLKQSRGLSASEAALRIDAQPPQQDKVARADVVIDNRGSLEQTRAQVAREWDRAVLAHRQTAALGIKLRDGGDMSSWRSFIEEHPNLTMWAVLAVGMVVIFLVTSRDTDLLPGQRLFMAGACVGLAGLCAWIIGWE